MNNVSLQSTSSSVSSFKILFLDSVISGEIWETSLSLHSRSDCFWGFFGCNPQFMVSGDPIWLRVLCLIFSVDRQRHWIPTFFPFNSGSFNREDLKHHQVMGLQRQYVTPHLPGACTLVNSRNGESPSTLQEIGFRTQCYAYG